MPYRRYSSKPIEEGSPTTPYLSIEPDANFYLCLECYTYANSKKKKLVIPEFCLRNGVDYGYVSGNFIKR